jgi:2-polyprenyl-3-methyl-5-hydroxy-6-metoxy-1,4-benzoquinol methylase
MNAGSSQAPCRVCGGTSVQELGTVEYYKGYAWAVHHCSDCGSRFTKHEEGTYEMLHSQEHSTYVRYRHLVQRCKVAFDRGSLEGIEAEFADSSKYRMVIEEIRRLPKTACLLEIGSSRGSLSSFPILAGYDVLGIDASEEAVKAARDNFGDHFALPGSPRMKEGAPYDLIYHIGTIGCVADPAGMTRDLLALLKPGGMLVFNAPNVEACALEGQWWLDTVPPPDVVTLFRPGFWIRQFSDLADVNEQVELSEPDRNVSLALARFFRCRWQKPVPEPIQSSESPPSSLPWARSKLCRFLERGARYLARKTGLARHVRACPTEFGFFVRMIRR